MPLDQTLAAFRQELNSTVVMDHARVRMSCLALRGSIEIGNNSKTAKHNDWTATLEIAISLGESQWAARAKGEHGVIAFLEGNTALAVSLVGSTILSAYRTGDKADLVTPSACDTNVGTAEGEASMMNIERAFSNPRRPSGNRQLMEC